jgi:hypothetical protein
MGLSKSTRNTAGVKSVSTGQHLSTYKCIIQHSYNNNYCSYLYLRWRCHLLWITLGRNISMWRLIVAVHSIVKSDYQPPRVCLSVRLNAWNKLYPTEWIVIIVYVWVFIVNCLEKAISNTIYQQYTVLYIQTDIKFIISR